MQRDGAAMGLLGVIALTWGLYLFAMEARELATSQRLAARTVAVEHSRGDTATRYVGGRRTMVTTPSVSITTFALPNGTQCTAEGGWGPNGARYTVLLPRGSDRCSVLSPLRYGIPGGLTLVGLVMVSAGFRQLRARAAADAARAAKMKAP